RIRGDLVTGVQTCALPIFPSGPTAMSVGWLAAVGTANSVTTPAVVIRPILLPACSVNHRLPSGPAVIPVGVLPAVGTAFSVTGWVSPYVGMRPTLFPAPSTRNSLPFGPGATPRGELAAVGIAYSVNTPAVVTRAILLPVFSVTHR